MYSTILTEGMIKKIVSSLFLERLKEIERYGQSADEIQWTQLKGLLRQAAATEWGERYRFKDIRSYREYAEQVPLQTYEDLKPFIGRMINGEKNVLWPFAVKWYAKSSGTTNDKSKFIPVTKDNLKKAHYQGGFDTLALYFKNYPDSRFLFRKSLVLGGSHSPSPLNKKSHYGDLSAVMLQKLNPLVDLVRVPSKKIILMGEWESKLQAIVEHVWNKDVSNLAGIPSWMLTLIRRVLEKTGKESLLEVWPNLEVFFHGGISFEPYREQYRTLIPSERMHYMETYNASEGFFGIQDDPKDQSMLLMIDYQTFYEFIPMKELGEEHPTVLPLEAVEPGVNYVMLISTSGGLWRYQIGDTIRFTSCFPHKFVITGRTKSFINAFGEELMVDNADKGISEACSQTGAKVKEYTVAPLFLLDRAKGRHQWLIEFEVFPSSLEEFATVLDQALQRLNSDYEAKRYKEISLQPLELIPARNGVFYEWLEQRGKLGGQHKIPRLNNDRTILDELLSMNVHPES